MIRRTIQRLREHLETQRWKALRAMGKPISFRFRDRQYYLNPEEGAIYHIRNSTNKIAKMCDLVVDTPRVVFDVGANCGLFSAFISEKFPTCQVFAFEPSLDLVPLIRLNCRSTNVTICEYAVASRDGVGTLFVNPASQQTNSLRRESVSLLAPKAIHELVVPCRSLDNVAAEHGIDIVDILKVDVQGFEGNVFRGAMRVLRTVQCLFVESTWMDLESIVGLIPFAVQYGFQYAAIVNPVYMGADIMLSRNPIPTDAGITQAFALSDGISRARWT